MKVQGPVGKTTHFQPNEMDSITDRDASPAQAETLTKMRRMGWVVTTTVHKPMAYDGIRIGVAARTGAKGWIEKDGSFTRVA